jgi:hypothetical protein
MQNRLPGFVAEASLCKTPYLLQNPVSPRETGTVAPQLRLAPFGAPCIYVGKDNCPCGTLVGGTYYCSYCCIALTPIRPEPRESFGW